jgi:hypothetical protein
MITGKAYLRILTALGVAAMLAMGCSGSKNGGMDPILPAGDPGARRFERGFQGILDFLILPLTFAPSVVNYD